MAEVERGDIGRTVVVSRRFRDQPAATRLQPHGRRPDRTRPAPGSVRPARGTRRGTAGREANESLPGEVRDVAVLFIDLAGSTQLPAHRSPREVAEVLNDFFRIVVAAVDERGGLINKFQGDAALAVFGAPVATDGAATAALHTARALAEQLRTLPVVDFGIGVSAGAVFAGNIGAENRDEYTVIGDPVNEAARLADIAKSTPGRTVSSSAAIDRATDDERETGQRWRRPPTWSLGTHPDLGAAGRATMATMTDVHPFRIDVPDDVLVDLRRRLAATRWPEAEWSVRSTGARDSAGLHPGARGVLGDRIRLAGKRSRSQPLRPVHHRDRRPRHPLHPSALTAPGRLPARHHPRLARIRRRVRKVIEPLTDPTAHGGRAEDAFHVVCPSLPGYGFSGKPTTTGWNVGRIARAWETLMVRLGYDRYGAQGGDWGCAVTAEIGRNVGHCVGIHINMPIGAARGGQRRPHGRGEGGARRDRPLPAMGLRLLQAAVHPTADARLRAGRLPRRTAGLDRREVLGVDRLRRPPRERAQPRRNARQRDALLGHRHRRLVGPAVLGELGGLRFRCPRGTSHGRGVVPQGDRPAAAGWCEANYNITHWTDDAARRPLRRLRTAGTVRRRRAGVLRDAALTWA